MNWRRLLRDTWAYALALPGRLSDWLTGPQFRGHGAVDISRPSEQVWLWCLTCNETYPCARLVTMEQETKR